MADQELIAKVVFGEATLGEVLKRFEYRISTVTITILRDDRPSVGYDYNSWWIEDGKIVLVGESGDYQRRCTFNLDTKVMVHDGYLELKENSDSYRLVLLETKKITFDEILPGAA